MQDNRLIELVKAYAEHFVQYSQTDYNETEVRNDFVNPFFEILGWDMLNKKKLPQHLREVKHEAAVYVEEDGVNRKRNQITHFIWEQKSVFSLKQKNRVLILCRTEKLHFKHVGMGGMEI